MEVNEAVRRGAKIVSKVHGKESIGKPKAPTLPQCGSLEEETPIAPQDHPPRIKNPTAREIEGRPVYTKLDEARMQGTILNRVRQKSVFTWDGSDAF